MANGWICLNRSLLDHWLWQDKPFSRGQAWIDLLLMTNHDENKFLLGSELIVVGRGEFVTSEIKLMERWGWSKEKTRKFLNTLIKDGMIEKKTDRRKTTIKIVNYGKFNDMQTREKPQKDHKKTTDRPQTDTNNKENNLNNDKQESEKPTLAPVKPFRHPTGEYNNVFLSNEEAAKLVQEFGEEIVKREIESLSNHLATKKNSYKDDAHYATLRKWIREDKEKPKTPKSKAQDFPQRTYTDDEYHEMEMRKLRKG